MKASIMLQNAFIMNRMLVEIGTLKVLLVSSQMEMGNTLLEARGKATLVIKWLRTWLNYVLVFCRR